MIELTHDTIDTPAVLRSVQSPNAGAVVLFLGTVRRTTDGRQTDSLLYECYPEMAEKELARLEEEAQRRWQLSRCAVVHRLGPMDVGETSVAIAVSSAHRQAAFEAGEWLIDRIKEVVPIWKQEHYTDGSRQWVHPGSDAAATPPGETNA